MDCFYINLDAETHRRAAVQENFNRFRTQNWDLTRFPAATADDVVKEGVGGRIRPAEKACLLSHRRIIAEIARRGDDALVAEDDVLFGPSTFVGLDALLRDPASNDWDVIFTDVGVPDIPTQYHLVRLKQEFQKTGQSRVIDLRFLPSFFGTTAYVVKAGAAEKMLSCFAENETLDLPYDIFMRRLVHDAKIKAGVVFPFLTSVADNSLASNIQPSTHEVADVAWLLFRRMIWTDGACADFAEKLEHFDDHVDADAKAFGKIWSVISDRNFLYK